MVVTGHRAHSTVRVFLMCELGELSQLRYFLFSLPLFSYFSYLEL